MNLLGGGSLLLERLAGLFERLNVHPLADDGDFVRFDVTDNVDQHGLTAACDDRDDQAFHGIRAARLEINTDVLILLLRGHDAFPAVGIELTTYFLYPLLDLGAVPVIQSDHVDPNDLKATDQVRDLRLALLNETRRH